MPLGLGIAGVLLTVIVGAEWLLLSVGGGLTSPVVVLRAFCRAPRWGSWRRSGSTEGWGSGRSATWPGSPSGSSAPC